MASTIKIKNSSTAGAVPTSSDLVQGELAINVTDRRIYTENASGTVVELGTPSIDDNGNATAITIDSSENVGIGTSSPSRKLEVSSNDAQTDLMVSRASNGLGTILRWDNTAGASYLYNNGVYPLLFGTNNTERARIDSSGNLLVGVTSTFNGGKLMVRSDTSFTGYNFRSDSQTAAGTGWGHFYGTSSSNSVANIIIYGNGNIQNANNSYGVLSDIKLKENIVDATPKLEKLMQVRVVNYNLTGDYENHKQIGVIAQELEQVFPSLVDETNDRDADGNDLGTTTKSVKMSVFTPMLIKAIQEQQAIINAQQATLTTLTARIEALENK